MAFLNMVEKPNSIHDFFPTMVTRLLCIEDRQMFREFFHISGFGTESTKIIKQDLQYSSNRL